MYGINNWCSIRAAAIEELEEQESSKSKVKPTYVSLENAVMNHIIDRRKIKMQQKINSSQIKMNRYYVLTKQKKRWKKIIL